MLARGRQPVKDKIFCCEGEFMDYRQRKTNETPALEMYDPQRAGKLHALLTRAIDDFLNLHPNTPKSEVILAIEVTREAYEKELYHRWLDR
jgi:hypothetical protein